VDTEPYASIIYWLLLFKSILKWIIGFRWYRFCNATTWTRWAFKRCAVMPITVPRANQRGYWKFPVHLSFSSGLSMKSPSFCLNKIGKATGELVGETFLSYTAYTGYWLPTKWFMEDLGWILVSHWPRWWILVCNGCLESIMELLVGSMTKKWRVRYSVGKTYKIIEDINYNVPPFIPQAYSRQ
jgi:hypothetical protein